MPRFILALAAAACIASSAPARAGEMADTVLAAMGRGYGTLCGLDNRPAASGGYYPCLDIGPYRFVKGYGRLTAYVVMPEAAPFQIYRSDDRGEEFLVRGEWVRDLAPRVAAWWSDEVGGGRGRREADEASSTRLRDAEREVLRHGAGPGADAAVGVPPVTAAPVPYSQGAYPGMPYPYPPQPSPAQGAVLQGPLQGPPQSGMAGGPQDPAPQRPGSLREAPIPTRPAAGGREIAPGVVQLPSGRPYQGQP